MKLLPTPRQRTTRAGANEYGMTLFLASGLGYIGLRDLAGDRTDPRKKRADIPLK